MAAEVAGYWIPILQFIAYLTTCIGTESWQRAMGRVNLFCDMEILDISKA